MDAESQPEADRESWLNRNVAGMALTSFLSDLGHETATAILPGYLTVLGAQPVDLGVIEGTSDAASSLVKLSAGWWSDRLRNRKPLVAAGYALTGAAVGLFAVATIWPVVLLLRFIGWLARGARGPARSAMLAESVTSGTRGKAFGLHRAADTLGATIGPLLAAWLLGLFAAEVGAAADAARPYRLVFLWTFLPGLGAAGVFMLLVTERRNAPGQARRLWTSVRALPSGFRRFLVGVGFFGAGDFSHTLLILAAIELLKPAYGPVAAAQWGAVLYAIHNALYAGASFPAGVLGDRLGHRGPLISGYLLGAAVMVGFGVVFATATASLAVLAVLFGLAGVYVGFMDTLEGALAADLIEEPTLRGTAFGVLGTVNGIGDLLSSVAVGLLWTAGAAYGFLYAAVFMVLGAVLLLRVR